MTHTESLLANLISDFYISSEKSQYEFGYNMFMEKSDFSSDFSNSWLEITELYRNLLPNTDMSSFRLEVAESGSFFIRKLFTEIVDDDTYVISTTYEHPNVNECLAKCKNKVLLRFNTITECNVDDLITKFTASKCKKVFVYMIGTSTCSGQIVPTYFFTQLKSRLNKLNIKNIFFLDDVHGMFITPRDYSIFDYILYTCHSLVSRFDMGLLWLKNEYQPLGFTNPARTLLYYNKLKLFLDKIHKIRLFPLYLTEYFAEELSITKHFELFTNTTPHIFALKTKGLAFNQSQYDILDEYNIRIGENLCYENFMRLRIQEFISESPEFLIKGLQESKKILAKNIRLSGIKDITFTNEQHIKNSSYYK